MEVNKICLNVLVGIPGAGKTTFCKSFQKLLLDKQSFVKPVHLCFDEFIKMDSKLDLENGSFKVQRRSLLALIEKIIIAIKNNDQTMLNLINNSLSQDFSCTNITISLEPYSENNVYTLLLDDNMYYRSMRYEIYKLAKKHSSGYLQTFFDVSLEEAKLRNATRPNPIPDEIISRMWIKMEHPGPRFYPWERNTIQVTDQLSIIESKILECSNHPEKPTEEAIAKQPVEQSVVHKIDLLLRKVVGSVMRTHHKGKFSSVDLKLLSEKVIERRKLILDEVKLGLVEVDPDSVTEEDLLMLF